MILLCAGLLAFLYWRRQQVHGGAAALISRLPSGNGVQLFIDVQALRQARLLELLAGSRTAEETSYRQFVDITGFDYREDLDTIIASYQRGDWFFLLRGRFQWDQIHEYTIAEGGSCANLRCSVASGQPRRFTSFYALLPNVLALAISDRPGAVSALSPRPQAAPADEELLHPVWIRIDTQAVQSADPLPAGTRPLVTAIQRTQQVTLSLDAAGEGFVAMLRAQYASEADAEAGRIHLEEMTRTLRSFLARANQQPDPRELAGVLAGGRFERKAQTVFGAWTIQREFLEAAVGSL
jgi:hypothetical protein